MNILLLGSNGYVGKEFIVQLIELKIPFMTLNRGECKLSFLRKFLKNNKITTIINAAGYTGRPNVDSCEIYKNDTIEGNILLPQILKGVCEEFNILLGHVSSGCIYNGYEKIFNELDEPNFTFKNNQYSFYSGTKAIAEEIIKELDKHYIWRLRIPFENINNDRNYITKLLNYKKLLNMKNSLSNKQEFVSACIQSIINRIPYGIYNVTNTGYIETKTITDLLSDILVKNRKFEFFNDINEFNKNVITQRSNCILDNSKLLSTGIHMSKIEDSIINCLYKWR